MRKIHFKIQRAGSYIIESAESHSSPIRPKVGARSYGSSVDHRELIQAVKRRRLDRTIGNES